MDIRIPNLNTLADVIDRLIVEVNKLAYFENQKRQEHAKPEPDAELVAHWDNLSRDCCEYRSMLKNEINKLFTEVVRDRDYNSLRELRTFSSPPKSVEDILADRCHDVANWSLRGDLARALEEKLSGLE